MRGLLRRPHRAELTEAQEAAHLARRKVLWGQRQPLGGKTSPTHAVASEHKDRPQNQKAFAADTAASTGQSKRSINQKLARAEALGGDVEKIAGCDVGAPKSSVYRADSKGLFDPPDAPPLL